jgi:hypothetical protein
MVMCEIDSNDILVKPMTSRKDKVMIATHKKMIEWLRKMGLHPKMQHLDNQASEAYKAAIEECGMTYQLITPHVHRANIAEKAIFKRSNITSQPFSPALMIHFQCIFGTDCYRKRKQH